MRATDLFESEEADTPWGSKETLPPSMTIPDMDPYYEYYRFLIAMAGYPAEESPTQSVTRDVPFIVPYTPIEHQWVVSLLKKLGRNPKHLTKLPSTEPKFINKESPVRPFKDYCK